MGICGMNNKSQRVNVTSTRTQSQTMYQNNQNQNTNVNDMKLNKEFKDFEEYNNGKMIGEGVKQIPAYKCQIPFDGLNNLREEFWKEKIKKNRRWRAIREICESDAATAAQLLEVAGFCCKDNLKTILEIENPEIVYKVPNYCITDPVFERDYEHFQNLNVDKVNINLFCWIVNDLKELKFLVFNTTTGKEVKELISKEENKPLDQYKIRLFFSGQEIKDDHPLYYHSMVDKSKIQVNYSKIDL